MVFCLFFTIAEINNTVLRCFCIAIGCFLSIIETHYKHNTFIKFITGNIVTRCKNIITRSTHSIDQYIKKMKGKGNFEHYANKKAI